MLLAVIQPVETVIHHKNDTCGKMIFVANSVRSGGTVIHHWDDTSYYIVVLQPVGTV